jgi:hypothetical protein
MKTDPALIMLTKDCLTKFREDRQPFYEMDENFVYLSPNGHYAVKLLKNRVEINLDRCLQSNILIPSFAKAATAEKLEETGVKIGRPNFKTFWLSELKNSRFTKYINENYAKPFQNFSSTEGPNDPVFCTSKTGLEALIMPRKL